jgi:hypothetical protein
MIKIDIVIPSYIKDFDCILSCIKNLSEQTIKPNNIIICVSEINNNHKIYLDDEVNKLQLNFNVIINDTPLKHNASENRNRGIEYCLNYTKPDYIMFCDCDDIIHTQKIESFIYFYNTMETNVNLFVHNYSFSQENFDIYAPITLNKDNLLLCNSYTNTIGLYTSPHVNIHHGHPTVKLELCKEIKYNENLNNGEDCVFCQSINTRYGNGYCCVEKLMKYIP